MHTVPQPEPERLLRRLHRRCLRVCVQACKSLVLCSALSALPALIIPSYNYIDYHHGYEWRGRESGGDGATDAVGVSFDFLNKRLEESGCGTSAAFDFMCLCVCVSGVEWQRETWRRGESGGDRFGDVMCATLLVHEAASD